GGSAAFFLAVPWGVRRKKRRGSPRHSEGDGKNMSCTHPHASIVRPHINALIMRVFHSSVRHSTEGFPASVPRWRRGVTRRWKKRPHIRHRSPSHFHGLIEFVGSHANFASIGPSCWRSRARS